MFQNCKYETHHFHNMMQWSVYEKLEENEAIQFR